jgi:hypothetical protein
MSNVASAERSAPLTLPVSYFTGKPTILQENLSSRPHHVECSLGPAGNSRTLRGMFSW